MCMCEGMRGFVQPKPWVNWWRTSIGRPTADKDVCAKHDCRVVLLEQKCLTSMAPVLFLLAVSKWGSHVA